MQSMLQPLTLRMGRPSQFWTIGAGQEMHRFFGNCIGRRAARLGPFLGRKQTNTIKTISILIRHAIAVGRTAVSKSWVLGQPEWDRHKLTHP
jgi:hypothetical protein